MLLHKFFALVFSTVIVTGSTLALAQDAPADQLIAVAATEVVEGGQQIFPGALGELVNGTRGEIGNNRYLAHQGVDNTRMFAFFTKTTNCPTCKHMLMPATVSQGVFLERYQDVSAHCPLGQTLQ